MTSGSGKRESLVGPVKSDSGGMRQVRRQLEWAERIGDEKESGTISFFKKFCCKWKQKMEVMKSSNFSLKKGNTGTCLYASGYDPRRKRWVIGGK